MLNRGTLTSLTLLTMTACALVACKGEKPPAPPKPTTTANASQTRTLDQAMASVMELPEVKQWAARIEKTSHGKWHGAVIEDDPAPSVIDGKSYYQLSFVENRPERVHRVQSFLVAREGHEVLVEDAVSGATLSLRDWRRNVRRVDVSAAN